jgi:phospholipid/cholesterol/gamma-HCH transport system ATP-binding protein
VSVIEYRSVYKAFDAPVLSGVSLTVPEGEMLAIVGPSGTGKSVLLKTTIGLIVPDRGDVLIDGESVFSGAPGVLLKIRQKAGYVFQNAALFDSLNVYENVSLGIQEHEAERLGTREVERRVWRSLEDVNLDPAAVQPKLPAELSGGMRKRVGLARAIVGRPQILLYDEPVTGLDPVNAAAVDQLIVEISEKTRVTSIIVTHDIEGALSICDRIGLLEGGKLRFIGTPEEFRQSDEPLVRAFADRQEASLAATRGDRAALRRRKSELTSTGRSS